MMITEAIRRANSEYTICALLTAYIETVQFSRELPTQVTALPMSGIEDLKSRLEDLVAESEATIRLPGLSAFNMVEAANVFVIAIERISEIQAEGSARRNAPGRSHDYHSLQETQAA